MPTNLTTNNCGGVLRSQQFKKNLYIYMYAYFVNCDFQESRNRSKLYERIF